MDVGDLKANHEAYVAAGQKKAEARKFKNVVNEPLIVAPDYTLLIDLIGVPELHCMTGISGKVMDNVEKTLNDAGQDGKQFVKHFLQKENIRRADQRGGKCFEGRVGNRICFLKKVDRLTFEFHGNQPQLTILACEHLILMLG